jgi:hypothetical protein
LSDFYSSQAWWRPGSEGIQEISVKKRGFLAENPLFLAGVADDDTKAGSFRHPPSVLSHRRIHHVNHTCRSIVCLATYGR